MVITSENKWSKINIRRTMLYMLISQDRKNESFLNLRCEDGDRKDISMGKSRSEWMKDCIANNRNSSSRRIPKILCKGWLHICSVLISAWIFCRLPWICCKWMPGSLVIQHLELLQLELALVDLAAVSGQVDSSDDSGYLSRKCAINIEIIKKYKIWDIRLRRLLLSLGVLLSTPTKCDL